MPTAVLDRLPLPNLQVYVVLSVLLMSSSIYYAFQMTSEMDAKGNSTTAMQSVAVNGDVVEESATNRHRNRVADILLYVLEEPLCIWTLINMAFCCLILIVRLIQRMVFGELRVSEQQHVKDKFWNFVFYKFIFIFGVMNVQFMDEVILWCGWFSVLGFLHLLAQLSKDRFEYLSFSPTTPKWTHIRLLSLLVGILGLSSALYVICILVGVHAGINTFAFMAAECVLLNVQTLYVIIRYAIHLYDLNLEGTWENRGTYIYYTELVFELTALIIDFCHHLHMLVWGNIFLSMASLVICMQLRCLLREIQRRVKKHKNFLRVVRHLEKNFPMATVEELRSNSDDCAICWDKMETARKLPCGHFFHNSCLRSWLEQDTSCPTCRTSLTYHDDNVVSNVGDEGPDTPTRQQDRPTTNHFFHFDGSRYVSWLPSFSVEVTHVQLLHGRQQPMQTSQLDSMAHQVQQLFPHIPMTAISDDLRVTRSVEQTIENVLDGRLLPSPFQANRSLPIQPNDNVQAPVALERTESAEDEPQVRRRAPGLLEMSSNDTEASDNSDAEEPEPMQSSGGRFSKSPRERETMLAGRKQDLIKSAKRRYLAKRCCERRPRNLDTPDAEEEEGSAVNRRYRSYEAARKRLFGQHDDT